MLIVPFSQSDKIFSQSNNLTCSFRINLLTAIKLHIAYIKREIACVLEFSMTRGFLGPQFNLK